MNNNVELCSDWLFHSAAHFSSSHSKQISTVREIQPYIFEPVSDEDTDFETLAE